MLHTHNTVWFATVVKPSVINDEIKTLKNAASAFTHSSGPLCGADVAY